MYLFSDSVDERWPVAVMMIMIGMDLLTRLALRLALCRLRAADALSHTRRGRSWGTCNVVFSIAVHVFC